MWLNLCLKIHSLRVPSSGTSISYTSAPILVFCSQDISVKKNEVYLLVFSTIPFSFVYASFKGSSQYINYFPYRVREFGLKIITWKYSALFSLICISSKKLLEWEIVCSSIASTDRPPHSKCKDYRTSEIFFKGRCFRLNIHLSLHIHSFH